MTHVQQTVDALTKESEDTRAAFDAFVKAIDAKVTTLESELAAAAKTVAPDLTALQTAVDGLKADVAAAKA